MSAGRVGRVCPQRGRAETKPREAYGVRGACSRCPMCGAVRKREQAPRTPYASRNTTAHLAPPVQFIPCSPGNLRKKTTISDIVIQRAGPRSRKYGGALRTDAPYPPLLLRHYPLVNRSNPL